MRSLTSTLHLWNYLLTPALWQWQQLHVMKMNRSKREVQKQPERTALYARTQNVNVQNRARHYGMLMVSFSCQRACFYSAVRNGLLSVPLKIRGRTLSLSLSPLFCLKFTVFFFFLGMRQLTLTLRRFQTFCRWLEIQHAKQILKDATPWPQKYPCWN